MRQLLNSILFLFIAVSLYAQRRDRIDSIFKIINETKEDTTLVRQYVRLTADYATIKPDSSLYFGNKAVKLSDKLDYNWGRAWGYRNLSSVFKIIGDYPNAWDYLHKAQQLYEKFADHNNIRFSEFAKGTLNYAQREYRTALNIFFRLDSTYGNVTGLNKYPMYSFIAASYTNLNKPDSALFYIKKMSIENYSDASWVYSILGDAYLIKKNNDSAFICYKLSNKLAIKKGNTLDIIQSSIGLAKTYKAIGNTDSSTWFAKIALTESENGFFKDQAIKAAGILASLFEKSNPAEAIKYYKLSSSLNDSLFNQQKLIQVQSLKYAEELRKREAEEKEKENKAKLQRYLLLGGLAAFAVITLLLVRNNRYRRKAHNRVLKAYDDLRGAQKQLIQQEKMASLGEMTAGIAHEIQNPLNFVNNFSEVNKDLLNELKEEIDKGNFNEVKVIANDVISNEEKITFHGKRADGIVKSMLQHSRSSSGQKELTDINALCDEYVRLSYHGLRAKDKSFNAKFETDFDTSIGKINIVPQDIGRVILNLINNAFYSVSAKQKQNLPGYEPGVLVSTEKAAGTVLIKVRDNGNGVPQAVMDKIFQPFFTTKPTGEGTGLGLSMSYDIITKGHGGELKVETKEGQFAEFTIILPV
jgi:signal transduction histidine kinase